MALPERRRGRRREGGTGNGCRLKQEESPLKKKASQITAVRLPAEVVCRIDTLVGKGNRSKFIAAAVEKELNPPKRPPSS
ncbi:MAG TPA: hypothetical protein GXX19_10815 [Syntrophomonadaceae bacterium]|nr:hypothetical protein [Syntrophomonadaceae bacterium]